MHISKELERGLLNTSDVEALASVLAVSHNSGGEWSTNASDAGSATVWTDFGIGER